jgi:hypothetical protein
MTRILLVLIFIGFGVSCDDDDSPQVIPTFEQMQICHLESGWVLDKAEQELIGRWDNRRSFNPWTGMTSDVAPGTNTIEFRTDHKATLKFGEDTFDDVTWMVGPTPIENWVITFDSDNYVSTSAFWLCKDAFVIVNSFVDGPDDLYIRMR